MAQAEPVADIGHVEEFPGPFTFGVDRAGALIWLQFNDGEYQETAAEVLATRGYRLDV